MILFNKKTVFMFPGQGAQTVGMREKLGELTSGQEKLFAVCDEILGFNLTSIIDNGPEDELTRTSNTQPALLAMDIAFVEKAEKLGYRADIVMGHSLGEYAALVHAGVLTFDEGIKLVSARGRLMEEATVKTPGKMAAVNRAKRELLDEVVTSCSELGVIEITNYNSPAQVVLSGEDRAVEQAVEMINNDRIGVAVKLNVSAPFHSSIMKPIAEEFSDYLGKVPFNKPDRIFINNVTGKAEDDPDKIREKLIKQLWNPVMWEDSMKTAKELGGERFVECGPGTVLSGLARKSGLGVEVLTGEKLTD